MRRDETIVMNDSVMPYVIPTPENYVIANFCKRLNRIAFEDKAVVTNDGVTPYKSPTTYIAHAFIAHLTDRLIESRPNAIKFC